MNPRDPRLREADVLRRTLQLVLCLCVALTACASGSSAPRVPQAASSPGPSGQADYRPPTDRPGPAVDKLFFKAFASDQAALEFQAGHMDAYLNGLTPSAAADMRAKPGVRLLEAPSMTIDILLNPAPAPAGQLNPFAIKGIRQAIQDLVNRDYVAGTIYRGQAASMLTPLAQSDFDYLTIFDIVKQLNFSYDPEGGPRADCAGDDRGGSHQDQRRLVVWWQAR